MLLASSLAAAMLLTPTVGAFDTDPVKTVTATCPGDQLVLGAAGRILNGDGGVALTAVVPSADLRSVTVTGHAQPGHTMPWSVGAVAVCGEADPALTVRVGPAPDVVSCPDDYRVIGTGFRLTGTGTGTDAEPPLLTGLVPGAGLHGVAVQASNAGVAAAYAICVTGAYKTYHPGLMDPVTGVLDAVVVPAGQYPIYGVGALVRSSAPGAFIDGLMIGTGQESASVHVVRPVGPLLTGDDASVTVYGINGYFY